MKKTKTLQFKSSLLILSMIVGSSFLSGCADPISLILGYNMLNKKNDDGRPPKFVCTDGIAKLESNSGDAGIVGGQTLYKDSWLAKGVVFIMQESGANCTGTLVDDNMVLTAAHCVEAVKSNYDTNLKVFFTNKPECDSQSGKLLDVSIPASGLKIHESYDDNANGLKNVGDIALIRLAEPAPKDFRPLKLAKDFVPMDRPVLLTGYGRTQKDAKGAYSLNNEGVILRVTQAPPLKPSSKAMLVAAYHATSQEQEELANQSTNKFLFIDQNDGHGVCNGDSGGPSLLKNDKGIYVVTGVTSFVWNPVEKNALCGFAAAHTSVTYYKTWLESAFQELRNSDSKKRSLFE